MVSIYSLLDSFPNLEPNCCSMSGPKCCFLTHIQISQETDKVVWYSQLFQNIPQFVVIHTKALMSSIKQKWMFFLKLSCFFYDPTDVGNLVSGPTAFTKCSLYIWNFSVHGLLKPNLENFEHAFTSVWDDCHCVVVWTFFGIAFLLDCSDNWPFPVLLPLLFSKCAGIWSAAL